MSPSESGSHSREELHFALVSQLLEAFTQSLQTEMLAQYGSYREIFTRADITCQPVVAIREHYHQGHWR